MIKIGNIKIDAPFFQAGLAGYSDSAMRLIARKHGCPYCVTEAMLDHFLINGGKGLAAAQKENSDTPLAGQLMGSSPKEIAQGAKILRQLGYDVIDINLACPVKKIKKKCRGGHLMSAPQEAIAILDAVKQAIADDLPCTVKLRRGSDDSTQATENFHQIFQAIIDLGYAGACVHGRTVQQKYNGPAKWAFLKELVQTYQATPNFNISGSGDIFCVKDIFDMIQQTGVHMVSVARGCIGNPWIFQQAKAHLAGDLQKATAPPTIAQQKQVLLQHFSLSMKLHGEKKAGMMMRKFGIKFSYHHPNPTAVSQAFIKTKSITDWQNVLQDFYHDRIPNPTKLVIPKNPSIKTNTP